MSGPKSPCRICGAQKDPSVEGYKTSWYCEPCGEARRVEIARKNSLCGNCLDFGECPACEKIISDKAADSYRRSVAKRRANHPSIFRPDHANKKHQIRAIAKVQVAVKKGLLPSLSGGEYLCSDCSNVAVAYDHRDYGKPLSVEPVCAACNWKRGTAKWPQDEQIESIMAKKA